MSYLPSIRSRLRIDYDSTKAFNAYQEYLKSRKDLSLRDELILQLVPLVRLIIIRNYWDIKDDQKEEAVNGALLSICEVVDSDKLPEVGSPMEFTYRFYKLLSSAIYKSIRASSGRVFNDWMTWTKIRSHPPTPRLSLLKIYLEELPSELSAMVISRIRFKGEAQRVCVYLLYKLLDGDEDICVTPLKDYFKVDVDFLLSYMIVLTRMALHDLKSNFNLSDLEAYSQLLEHSVSAYAESTYHELESDA